MRRATRLPGSEAEYWSARRGSRAGMYGEVGNLEDGVSLRVL